MQAWALLENMHTQNWHCVSAYLIDWLVHSLIPGSECQSWLLFCGWPYLGRQYISRSCTLMWSELDWTSLWQSVHLWPGPNILPSTWQNRSLWGSLSSMICPACHRQLSVWYLISDMMAGQKIHSKVRPACWRSLKCNKDVPAKKQPTPSKDCPVLTAWSWSTFC